MENQDFRQNNDFLVRSDSSSQPPFSSLIPPFSGATTQHHHQQAAALITGGDNEDDNGYYEDAVDYLDSFPAGYRFRPLDKELVQHYLKIKLMNLPLPPNRMHEVNIYDENPDTLAENYIAQGERDQGEKEWYFFTSRNKKYPNGKRPNRAGKDGYWKATGSDKHVKFNGRLIGYKKILVFYQGRPKNTKKTSWIMHEYRVDTPSNSPTTQNDTKLDCVLCKIYNRESGTRNSRQVVDDDGMNEDIEQPIMRSSPENSIAGTSEGTNSMHNVTAALVPHSLGIDQFGHHEATAKPQIQEFNVISPQVFNQQFSPPKTEDCISRLLEPYYQPSLEEIFSIPYPP
ncbi:NAC transcription factor 32-like [Cornus florida]|uniref:NAC transcription factor 32-like n=1 Tax=Cornus florida TaxID=4283 RepID=UPI0028A01A58|nr:NAC transcription factor 32-like [Cornus florida]